uniref:Retrovirus-related Pol polyprotein from transposon TNT 1-94-like beta-barrel domain-containing protein n=1 Tax=Populus alba TaxID=43335 RepID=A0A4U5PK18_POPAL|nr:hypothetical protein D5086_0000215920 [Populus alba]
MSSRNADHSQYRPLSDNKAYKGRRPDFKCQHCHNLGHHVDRCWLLDPELSQKFAKDFRRQTRRNNSKSYLAHSNYNPTEINSATPGTLISDFANYLQDKQVQGKSLDQQTSQDQKQSTALPSQFADFLAETDPEYNQGKLFAFITVLELVNLHDFWIIDSGATDHMSNKLTSIHDFKSFVHPNFVSIADGKNAYVKGKGTSGAVFFEFFPLPSIENTNQLLSTVTSIDGVLPSPDQHTQSSTGFIPSNDCLGPHQLPAETNPASNPSSNILQQHHSQTEHQIQLQSASDSNRFQIDHISNLTLPDSALPDTFDPLLVTRRVSIRSCQPPSRMQDYVTYNVRYLVSKFMSYHRLSPTHSAFLTSISNVHEPKSFKEAQSQPV